MLRETLQQPQEEASLQQVQQDQDEHEQPLLREPLQQPQDEASLQQDQEQPLQGLQESQGAYAAVVGPVAGFAVDRRAVGTAVGHPVVVGQRADS